MVDLLQKRIIEVINMKRVIAFIYFIDFTRVSLVSYIDIAVLASSLLAFAWYVFSAPSFTALPGCFVLDVFLNI